MMIRSMLLLVGMLAQIIPPPGVPVYDAKGHQLSGPTPAPAVERVAVIPIPCSTLVRYSGMKFSDQVTPQNVGKLFGAALDLRGAHGKSVPREVFDLAYNDVLHCFNWGGK